MEPKDFYMDEVGTIALKAHDVIEEELKKYNITLTDEQSDILWDVIWKEVEQYSNGNYLHEM